MRPTRSLREPLKVLCKNVDLVCRESSVNSYMPANTIDAYKYFKLYDFLIENRKYSSLDRLRRNREYDVQNVVVDKRKQRRHQLMAIKDLNQNLSGKFLVPEINQIEQIETRNFSNTTNTSHLENKF